MADDPDPQLSKPINGDDDIPSQEEINEKPYYDNGSALTIPNPTNNSQSQIQNPVNNPPLSNYDHNNNIQPQYSNQNNMQAPIYNPNNNQPQYYPPGTPQQANQAYPGSDPYNQPPINYNNMNYNDDIYYNSQPQIELQRTSCLQKPKTVIFLSILLIIIVIVDIILQIINEFVIFLLIDDAALLTIAITFLIFICIGKSLRQPALGAVTAIVWFVGIGLRGYGMSKFRGFRTVIGFVFILVVRTIIIFLCIPITNNPRKKT